MALAERKPRLSRLWLTAGIAGLLIALAGAALWTIQRRSAPITIAVLPLDNLSRNPADNYFADGFTEEIIRNLSVIEGLAVRSRTSSFAFKGNLRNIREAGKQLQADYILEGSVLRIGQQLRVNARLVRVSDDFTLWSGRFDRELTNVFIVQDEISRGIVNNLRLKLGGGRRRYETSIEAYDLYLRARSLSSRQSVAVFEEVIAKDPSFAPAYAGLASAYAVRSVQFPLDHPDDEVAKMRTAAEKAIQLDPLLAEAYDALALADARDGQWKKAEESFRHAIQLDPNQSRLITITAIGFSPCSAIWMKRSSNYVLRRRWIHCLRSFSETWLKYSFPYADMMKHPSTAENCQRTCLIRTNVWRGSG